MNNKYGFQFYHWHLEPSSRCTLRCPRCPREEMSKNIPWLQKDISIELFKKVFSEEMLKTQVRRITMCGDVGDPIYCKDYLEICRYIKETNPSIHIYTITNGSYKKKEWWQEFGQILNERDTVAFSIDGYDNASNNLYRVNSDWDSIIQGLTTLTAMGRAHVTWATIVFAFNQDHLKTIEELARSSGCDSLQITKSIKFGSRFASYNTDFDTDALEPRPEHVSQTGRYERYSIQLSDRILDNTEYLETNTVLWQQTVNEYSNKYVIPLCLIGNRGLYLNAAGQLYPCSWVAAPHLGRHSPVTGKHLKLEDSLFRKYEHLFDTNTRSLEEIINDPVWEKLFQSWNNKEGSFIECEEKCINKQVQNEIYSVGYLTN
jgi:MoaA/NifB/PqqE/SkfB family radical SAM enzyme